MPWVAPACTPRAGVPGCAAVRRDARPPPPARPSSMWVSVMCNSCSWAIAGYFQTAQALQLPLPNAHRAAAAAQHRTHQAAGTRVSAGRASENEAVCWVAGLWFLAAGARIQCALSAERSPRQSRSGALVAAGGRGAERAGWQDPPHPGPAPDAGCAPAARPAPVRTRLQGEADGMAQAASGALQCSAAAVLVCA